MIERKFVNQNIKEFEIKEYVRDNLSRVGLSDVKLQRTPLGEKIIISTSRPGLVVGRSGTNITKLTRDLKRVFKLDNPQIEIEEVTNIGLDAGIIAEMIANSLEKFGTTRFKGIGHKAMSDVMGAGALGVEILVSGKVPSSRAKTWRFYKGYLKKCGDIAISEVKVAFTVAKLKSGTLGIKVSIMTPDTILPDKIALKKEFGEPDVEVGEVADKAVEEEIKEKVEKLESTDLVADKPDKKDSKSEKKTDEKKKEKKPRKKPVKEVKKSQSSLSSGTLRNEVSGAQKRKGVSRELEATPQTEEKSQEKKPEVKKQKSEPDLEGKQEGKQEEKEVSTPEPLPKDTKEEKPENEV